MPPGGANDGLVAALDLRREFPDLPVVVLSAYVADPYVDRLLADAEVGVGYLLKERVGRVEDFLSSLDVVLAGGVVVGPEVVSHLMGAQARTLARLTDREREVLVLMAQGLSNAQIADRLAVSAPAVSKHVANIFLKLDLPPGEDNRRVRAVLAWLRAESPQIPAPAVARDRRRGGPASPRGRRGADSRRRMGAGRVTRASIPPRLLDRAALRLLLRIEDPHRPGNRHHHELHVRRRRPHHARGPGDDGPGGLPGDHQPSHQSRNARAHVLRPDLDRRRLLDRSGSDHLPGRPFDPEDPEEERRLRGR
jgi:DNA-binding NarL/FixJ family response regulator